ncbi:hypothetical protein [Microbacterium aurugineum]|uniref:PH domain-containing protein n=1 Tax=Microbacterium aurugineum TaxID=2851642 RepID=A0ABY4IWK5_9MICO|nr:hypothetical protein [Microbacterium aurugineum]UPL17132.1 hypothetical protein KV397_04815 [Microbacterium aurugineum]
MTEDTAADARVRATVTRKLVRNPLVWGAVLLLGAVGCTLAGDDLSFFPYLLMLVGGWCFGFAFVNAALAMVPARNGAMLHAGVALVLGALVAAVVEFGAELREPLPEAVRRVALVLQLAVVPAVGWIWFGLLSRVLALIPPRDAKKRPRLATPYWERDECGGGTLVRFVAIPLRMRSLAQAIVAIVVVGGLLGGGLLIALDDIVMRMGPRIAVVLLGLVLGLPVYLLFMAMLRRRAVQCSVAFTDDEVRVSVDDTTHRIPFPAIEFLRWRCRSDYARIEVRGGGADLSLFAGLATQPGGLSAELPALPERVHRRLERTGLIVETARRGEVITFRRPGPSASHARGQ